jgi:predicted permease
MRYALRLLARSPLFTTAAALTLALGIGANTAIFSVLNAVLLRPLPLHEPERLTMLWETNPQVGSFLANRLPAAMRNVRAWKERSRSFSSTGTLETTSYNLTGLDKPERIESARVSTDLFGTLGVRAGAGRLFTAADARERIAVVTHAFAMGRFGGPAAALGKTLRLNGAVYPVAGVLPPEFHLPAAWEGFDVKKPDIFVPRESDPARPDDTARVNLVYGRLKPGATVAQARAEILSFARVLQSEFKDLNAGFGASVFPVLVENTSPALRRNLLALQLAVALVLLICCANIMNLLLARLAARERELAICTALGAGRARMVAQLLSETAIIAGAGAALGWLLASLAIEGIVALKPDIHHLDKIRLDPTVFGFTCLVAVLAALASGLIPALIASRRDPTSVLGMQSRALSADVSGRVRRALIVCEVALGMVLLAGAGLMIRSMMAVLRVDPGFGSDALVAHIALPEAQYSRPDQVKAFCRQLLDRVSALPGVRAAAIVNGIPLESISVSSYAVAGRPRPARGSEPMADVRAASERYFEALGMRIVRGRAFTRQEAEKEAPVVLINESLARQIWPGQDPIGKALYLANSDGRQQPSPVIGLVADSRQMGPETAPRPEMYAPGRALRGMTLVVRAAGDVRRAVSEAVWSIDRDLPVHNVTTVADILHSNVSQRRFNMVLLAVFAGLALVLAAVGVYGVVAYTVAGRTREIGIRIALGARGAEVLGMIVRQSMKPVAVGLAIGLATAFAVTRAAASLLFGVSAADPLSFLAAATALALVAALAALGPAHRASRQEPVSALRHEKQGAAESLSPKPKTLPRRAPGTAAAAGSRSAHRGGPRFRSRR